MELYILLQDVPNPFPIGETIAAVVTAVLGIFVRWFEKRKMKRKWKQNSRP